MSCPTGVGAHHKLAGKTAGGGGQNAHDVGVLEVDDVALGAEALELGASVLGRAVKTLDGHRAVTVDAQIDRAETAGTDLSLESHLPAKLPKLLLGTLASPGCSGWRQCLAV